MPAKVQRSVTAAGERSSSTCAASPQSKTSTPLDAPRSTPRTPRPDTGFNPFGALGACSESNGRPSQRHLERGGVVRPLVAADSRRRLAAVTAMLAICGSAAGAAEAAQARPRLPARLILPDGQQGVAGETGTIGTIERDGRIQ